MDQVHNLIIIGSGPAGYTAGIYTGRAALAPLLFAGKEIGGQLMYTTEVENFPGFAQGILGPQLMMAMREQAQRFGTQIEDTEVDSVDLSQKPFQVKTTNTIYYANALIVATGAQALTLKLPGEQEFIGKGISTCAVCDAAFYRNKTVYVVGGGDSAIEDAMALTKFTSNVNLLVRRDQLRASKIMQDKILNNPKVKIWWNTQVNALLGEQKLTGLKLQKKDTEIIQVETDGLFYAIGHRPSTEIFIDKLKMTESGYILTSLTGLDTGINIAQTWAENYPTMTSVAGVFAAGDCVDFRYRQVASSAGMGTMAALDSEKWLLKNT